MTKFFIDLDGVLAKYDLETEKKMYDKNFFRTRPLYNGALDFVKNLYSKHKDNIYILSKLPYKKSFAREEKIEWVKEHFPFISEDNIHILTADKKKGSYVKNLFPDTTNILYDDFTDNLIEWEEQGQNFIGIKVINDINNKNGRWTKLGKPSISFKTKEK